jgi:hypothetical protein
MRESKMTDLQNRLLPCAKQHGFDYAETWNELVDTVADCDFSLDERPVLWST